MGQPNDAGPLMVPQILLCGLFGPREQMAPWLQTVSAWLPLMYSIQALREVAVNTRPTADFWCYVAVVAGCVLALLIIAHHVAAPDTVSVPQRRGGRRAGDLARAARLGQAAFDDGMSSAPGTH